MAGQEYTLKYTGAQIDERLDKAGNAVLFTAQNLTEAQKAQARDNIGAGMVNTVNGVAPDKNGNVEVSGTGGSADAVLYTEQTLADEQKAQARENIGAASQADMDLLRIEGIPGNNLFNKNACVSGVEIAPGSGILQPSYLDTNLVSEPIPVIGGEFYTFSGGDWRKGYTYIKIYALYNADGELLSYVDSHSITGTPEPYTIQTPSNAAYIRLEFSSVTYAKTLQFEHGTIATAYSEYGIRGYKLTGVSIPKSKILDDTGGFDASRYTIPTLALYGDTMGMSKDNAVTLKYVYGDRSGTLTCKWQGQTSLSKQKKNYTVKFDSAFEAVEGWGEQNKYCLKANFVDPSQTRNVVNAKLWGQMARARSTVPEHLSNLPNCGAIDGFPIIITINNEFHGLYTFNIPKDAWMFGMGDGTQEAIVGAEVATDATKFKSTALVDKTDFDLEYVTDEDNAGWVKTSLNRLISACINSNGTDLDTTISQYIDWPSAIDYYIFAVLITGLDITDKNYLLVTFDGTKWYMSPYDLDTTHGLHWNGDQYVAANYVSFASFANGHRLMELIKTYKKADLKARYTQLRSSVLSEINVAKMFNSFAAKIPLPLYVKDAELWNEMMTTATSNVGQILDNFRMNVAAADKWMEQL